MCCAAFLFAYAKQQEKKGGDYPMQQNGDFINNKCKLCGKSDLVLSNLHLTCNYGSKYDGEDLRLALCGECADKMLEFIQGDNRNEQ